MVKRGTPCRTHCSYKLVENSVVHPRCTAMSQISCPKLLHAWAKNKTKPSKIIFQKRVCFWLIENRPINSSTIQVRSGCNLPFEDHHSKPTFSTALELMFNSYNQDCSDNNKLNSWHYKGNRMWLVIFLFYTHTHTYTLIYNICIYTLHDNLAFCDVKLFVVDPECYFAPQLKCKIVKKLRIFQEIANWNVLYKMF